MPIDRDAKHRIRDLLDAAESAGETREAALEAVERWVAEQQADPGRAEQLANFASREADRYRLTPDRTLPDDLESAARVLRGLAEHMVQGGESLGWLAQVRAHWPAPIAHEVARLHEDLQGQPDGAGRRLPPSPEAALLQARDTAEVLIKLCACVLLQGLIAAGGDDADWARRSAFRRGLMVGTWVGMLRESIGRVGALPPGPLPGLAAILELDLLPFANAYPQMRNRGIGHGARASDPRETAALVEAMLESGRLPLANGAVKCEPLFGTLTALAKAGAFAGWRLQTLGEPAPASADGQDPGTADSCIDLTGAGAASHWLADPCHDAGHHQGRRLDLEMRLPDGGRLALSPLVAARICEQCGRRDLLLYDSMNDLGRGGRFDLLDYARGHKSRLWGSDEPDLGEAIIGLDIPLAELPPAGLRDATLSQGWVLRALDQARVDRNYRSPRYLRADLAAFLAECAGGVYWLQAPAHVGKTTFIQGLAGDSELTDEPIDPRFDPAARTAGGAPAPGRIVAYYCRKEYRPGVGGLLSRLDDRLAAVYDPSDNVKNDRPLPPNRTGAPTPERFVEWLQDWRRFAAQRIHYTAILGPLIVCIDGLDESRPPAEGDWPLQVLPTADLLPAGLYLVLTSRPLDDPTSPTFLSERITPLYAGDGVAQDVGAPGGRGDLQGDHHRQCR